MQKKPNKNKKEKQLPKQNKPSNQPQGNRIDEKIQ